MSDASLDCLQQSTRPPLGLPGSAFSLLGAEGLVEAVGRWIGWSGWLVVDRGSVDAFSRTTGGEESEMVPLGPALSLAGALAPTICRVQGRQHAVNHGLDDVASRRQPSLGGRMRVAIQLHHTAPRDVGLDAYRRLLAQAAARSAHCSRPC
jgi:hypothetical protein